MGLAVKRLYVGKRALAAVDRCQKHVQHTLSHAGTTMQSWHNDIQRSMIYGLGPALRRACLQHGGTGAGSITRYPHPASQLSTHLHLPYVRMAFDGLAMCPCEGIYGETSLEDPFLLDEAFPGAIDAFPALDDAFVDVAIQEKQTLEDHTGFGEFFDFEAACLEAACLEATCLEATCLEDIDVFPAFEALPSLTFSTDLSSPSPGTEPMTICATCLEDIDVFPAFEALPSLTVSTDLSPPSPVTEPMTICRRQSKPMLLYATS